MTQPQPDDQPQNGPQDRTQSVQQVEEVLVEEVSIDGMCGVY